MYLPPGNGGTGLGLAISSELVQLMNGTLSVESRLGQGSKFFFSIRFKRSAGNTITSINQHRGKGTVKGLADDSYLPINGPEAPGNRIEETPFVLDPMIPDSPRLLLVEDNEINQRIMAEIFKNHQLRCDIVSNGKDAIQALRRVEYDIIFMDYQMPEMDGYETTAKIREIEGKQRHTIIIAMTASAMEGDRQRCLQAGMDEYISKPINLETLFQLLAKYLIVEKKLPQEGIKAMLENSLPIFMANTGIGEKESRDLFERFFKSLPQTIANMETAIINDDCSMCYDFAHQLKGSSAFLRLTSISDLASKLAERARAGKEKNCRQYLEEIMSLFL